MLAFAGAKLSGAISYRLNGPASTGHSKSTPAAEPVLETPGGGHGQPSYSSRFDRSSPLSHCQFLLIKPGFILVLVFIDVLLMPGAIGRPP